MAKNKSQFMTYVKYDFKRTDKDTEILQAYNDTIKHLGNLQGLEGLKFQSWIPTVLGQEDYPLPTNKSHILHPVRFIKSATRSEGYPLIRLNKDEWSELYPNPNASDISVLHKGMPINYCIFSNSILIGPVPDTSGYIIEMDWSKLPTNQSADVDVQELGECWEEVIKWGTLARLYEGMGMTAEADRYWTLYRNEELGYPKLMENEKPQTGTMATVKFRDI